MKLKNLKCTGMYGPIYLAVLSLVSGQALAQSTAVNFIGSNQSDWKTDLSLTTTPPGSIQRGSNDAGLMVWRNNPVPIAEVGDEYGIGGTYDLKQDVGFSHGFFAPHSPDTGIVDERGFGVAFQNRFANGADDVLLLVNGSRLSLTAPALSFDFPDHPDPNASAFVSYRFTFTKKDKLVWGIAGEVVNNKGATILKVDRNFRMDTFQAEYFGGQVELFVSPSADGSHELRNIHGLSWDVSPVPEPSSLMLCALGGITLLTRRKRT